MLREHGITVPGGSEFTNKQNAINYATKFKGGFVVKPKSTNYGIGISIFKNPASLEDITKAVEIAFGFDNTILIENFINGNEYRFLVIDNKISAVMHRVPANVVGDGVSTIEQLVEEKNTDVLRGVHYEKPLEKIIIDDSVELFLKLQNLNRKSVIEKDKKVFLRENSNISTGGDSIDVTDLVDEHFKELAIAAAKTVDVMFCGVDIMISDYTNPKSDYGVIELNFNPAIHMHCFPYQGQGRPVCKDILKALELI